MLVDEGAVQITERFYVKPVVNGPLTVAKPLKPFYALAETQQTNKL